ncbi:unnamed protein product [Jaminaea pallidilutea]
MRALVSNGRDNHQWRKWTGSPACLSEEPIAAPVAPGIFTDEHGSFAPSLPHLKSTRLRDSSVGCTSTKE